MKKECSDGKKHNQVHHQCCEDHCKMVFPLGDRFERKEKLKHFDRAALGSQSPRMSLWVWPWEQPPAGGAWTLRVQLEDPW